MDKEKCFGLFQAFAKAPMNEFLDVLFNPLNNEQRQSLLLMNVSYHRFNAQLVALEAWMYLAPIEKNQWIMARVEMDGISGKIEELYFTEGPQQQQNLPSLEACIDYYAKKG